MKKYLMMFAAVLVAITIAAPAMAAIEFKYGGQFRVRWISDNNLIDGSSEDGRLTEGLTNLLGRTRFLQDHDNKVDQRLRLYFTFQSSENLKVVVKFEMGDTVWGNSTANNNLGTSFNGLRTGPSSGGQVGADATSVELKNAYLDFAIPCTPTRAILGIQTITLLDSWVIDDDFSSALLVTKLDPFKITVGYVAGQNNKDLNDLNGSSYGLYSREKENIDDWTLIVDYKEGPFKATLLGYFQDGHSTPVSFVPSSLNTPQTVPTPPSLQNSIKWASQGGTGIPGSAFNSATFVAGPQAATTFLGNRVFDVTDNKLFDLGFNFTYKVDWLMAYVNFVKNFGSVNIDQASALLPFNTPFAPNGVFATAADILAATRDQRSHDYTGWMVDAGVSYYCGPWTANLGGFYTTGQSLKTDFVTSQAAGFDFKHYVVDKDINFFTYPLATAKFFSEIVGGGILDGAASPGTYGNDGVNYWKGYQFPTNLWTVTVGGAWQVLDKTKLSLSYWYFGTAEKVMSKGVFDFDGHLIGQKFSSEIGHELDFYLTQGVVDGLTLDLVAAYLFTGDAYVNSWNGRGFGLSTTGAAAVPLGGGYNFAKDDAWKLGARLQWNF